MDEYALGSPLFGKAVIHRDTGAVITISAPGNAPDKRYVGSLTLDGKPWTHNFLPWADLADGAELRFTMQAEPNRERGTQEADLPYSMSRSQCR